MPPRPRLPRAPSEPRRRRASSWSPELCSTNVVANAPMSCPTTAPRGRRGSCTHARRNRRHPGPHRGLTWHPPPRRRSVCRPPHCQFAQGPREEVIRISLGRLQVSCNASVSLLKLVGFEVLGQVLLVVPRETDLVLLLRWNRTIDGSVQESTSWHVDDLDPDHPTTIDLLKCRPDSSRNRDQTTDVQRRDHTHDVGQVDDDYPILDPTRDHRISQSILQCVHHCAHCPLPVLGDGA
mmetsp:Transcript_99209/g.318348  ORF Transcript_99209/g.318348 Transcript_99209/m.318348 type:complete len:237 (+) Transcript_99209:719-1429(+)